MSVSSTRPSSVRIHLNECKISKLSTIFTALNFRQKNSHPKMASTWVGVPGTANPFTAVLAAAAVGQSALQNE